MNADVTERFWAKVNKNGPTQPHMETACWLWLGSLTDKGYGRLMIKYVMHRAHRFSWELHNGGIAENFFVLHKCDNPSCANPDHLFLGTQRDNMEDKAIKGRAPKGEASALAKLTEKQVISIREQYTNGARGMDLAAQYGVCRATISLIVNRKLWAHI